MDLTFQVLVQYCFLHHFTFTPDRSITEHSFCFGPAASFFLDMKITQSCLILCNPMGYTVHGILQARILEWEDFLLQRIFPTQGSSPGLLHCKQILYHLSHQGNENQNYKSKQSGWPSLKSPQIINTIEGMEKKEPSFTVGGNINWCSLYGYQYVHAC